MTAEVVNLRLVRKQKQRVDRADRAVVNSALHGRSKSQRHLEAIEAARAARSLDAHRLEQTGEEDDHRS